MRFRTLSLALLLTTLLPAVAMLSRAMAADNRELIHYPAEGNLKLADGVRGRHHRGATDAEIAFFSVLCVCRASVVFFLSCFGCGSAASD